MKQSFRYYAPYIATIMLEKHGLKNINISDDLSANETLSNIINFLGLDSIIKICETNLDSTSHINFKLSSSSQIDSSQFKEALIKFQDHLIITDKSIHDTEVEDTIFYYNEIIKTIPKNYTIHFGCSSENESICKAKNNFPECWFFKTVSNAKTAEIISDYYASEKRNVSVQLSWGKNTFLYAIHKT